VASWFETRGVAALLTMRVWIVNVWIEKDVGPHPEERALARVSKDEATELEKCANLTP
jgi:hypothetical protein